MTKHLHYSPTNGLSINNCAGIVARFFDTFDNFMLYMERDIACCCKLDVAKAALEDGAIWSTSTSTISLTSVENFIKSWDSNHKEPAVKGHKWAKEMAQYAQDAMETEFPWERWQFRCDDGGSWLQCSENPEWVKSHQYRRKPDIININGYDVPAPLRVAPEHTTWVYIPALTSNELYHTTKWSGLNTDTRIFNRGLVHSTKEAAQQHARALLSFTSTGEES